MALVLADRVRETTTTAGSGTITLAGAEPGYQSFSAIGNGNQTYYVIAGDTEWEVGIGTYTASGTTLSRDTVLSSSDNGAKVTFSAGSKRVFVSYPSEKSVNLDVSGNISLSSAVISGVAYPTVNSDAATKLYVDTMVSSGITYHEPVKYEVPNTTGNLNATYNNGTAGVSATLTNAGSLVPFIPDGVTASISDRVIVYNQTNAFENGVYTVTVVGDGSTAWVLTRASDADTYAVKSPNSLGQGDAFFVTSGDTGAGETYLCNTSGTIVFGSTAISFVQISSAQVYKAGNGISLTGTTISLVSPVAVANGGTGTTATPTNGQLLIGNGTNYTLSTLTAGSGVSITNSAGSITLSATGLGGTVTAVTATGPLASSGGTTPDISIANSTGTGSVVLQSDAVIYSATITAATSASITTITGSSANITTVTGTTAGFSSAAITQLSGTSAGITTVSGTTTTFSSGTISQFGATSATITTLSGTNVSYPNASFTSASITNLALTSLTLSNLSIASANITTLTGTNLSYASATITTGNLAFTGTAQRITGDMSNATLTSRLAFQTSTTDGATRLMVLPNGTSTTSAFNLLNSSDANNASYLTLACESTVAAFRATNAGTGTLLPMAWVTGGSERMRLDTSGNLGIGTASFTQKLAINSANTSTNSLVEYKQGDVTQAYVGMGSDNILRIESLARPTGVVAGGANYAFVTTNGTERMRIDSSGNVGIGTTNATFKLVAANSGTDGGWMYSTGSVSVLGLGGYANAGDGAFQIRYDRSTGGITFNGGTRDTPAARIAVDTSGNVGIGTASPSTKLTVIGAVTANGSGTAAEELLIADCDGGFTNTSAVALRRSGTNMGKIDADYFQGMRFYVTNGSGGAATQRMCISTAGNVGIGTASPTNFGGTNVNITAPSSSTYASTLWVSGTYVMQALINQTAAVMAFGARSNHHFAICTNDTERARFSAAGGFSVGTTADPGAGAIYATGNITAYYSDARLKDFKGKIDGALNKVSQLNGYYYTENAKAEEFGYNNKAMQVGVSAQEVKAVLPEVVSAAPFDLDEKGESKSGENYMTVNYEKLVPLLIEAIKELKAEVEALKAAK